MDHDMHNRFVRSLQNMAVVCYSDATHGLSVRATGRRANVVEQQPADSLQVNLARQPTAGEQRARLLPNGKGTFLVGED